MDNTTTENAKTKMAQALALIKEALDMSIPLFNTDQKNNILALWEAFIKEIVDYIKHKSRETGINLINNISLSKIWFG